MVFLLRGGTRSKNLVFSTKLNSSDAGMPGKVFTGMEMKAEEGKLLESLKESLMAFHMALPCQVGKKEDISNNLAYLLHGELPLFRVPT